MSVDTLKLYRIFVAIIIILAIVNIDPVLAPDNSQGLSYSHDAQINIL